MSRLTDVQRKWLAELARLVQAEATEPAIDLRQVSAASLPKQPAAPGLVSHMAHAAGDGDANTTPESGGGAPKANEPQPSPAESRRKNPPDLESQIGQHPATDVINDILEQEEGNRPRNPKETADRVRGVTADPSRSGSRVHEVLRDNPDWDELVERLNQRRIQSRNNRHARKARGKERKAERIREGALGGGRDGGGTPPSQGSSGSAAKEGFAPKAPVQSPTVAQNINIKAAEDYLHKVQELQKQSKAPKAETAKLQQQNQSLKTDGEVLANELQKHPELSSIRATNAKEFFKGVRVKFGGVRDGLSKAAVVAMRLADAYQLAQQIAFILDSKSMSEALDRSMKVGGDIAKERIKFGALRFVFRSTPAAIGVTVFLGDMDMNLSLSASGEFNREIAELVNGVRPGSVQPAQTHDTVTNFKDDEAKALFEDIRAQAKRTLKGELAKGLEQLGDKAGLVGAKQTNFEVSEAERSILGVDEAWFESAYSKGFDKANARREGLLKRARTLGKQDGRTGSRANDGSWQHWPEVKTFAGQGAPVTSLFPALQNGYDEEYQRMALTAGERVQRDKQSAALKRAYELGVQDRRAGQRQHVQDIAKWPEIEATDAVEQGARMQLLDALLKSYDRGFQALS